jgi:hypothetical protein
VNVEERPGPHDPLTRWVDHVACWQMQYRGSLGESLLHVLIICDTVIHTRLSRLLLKHYPMLSQDVVEGEEYLGTSCSIRHCLNWTYIELLAHYIVHQFFPTVLAYYFTKDIKLTVPYGRNKLSCSRVS